MGNMNPNLKIVFAGTPEFARIGLEAILDAGLSVPLVMTQPDRPAGRGMQLRPSAVKELALQKGIQVLQPTGLRLDGRYGEEAQHAKMVLEALQPDVIVVAAYGLILPQWVLDLPKYGCLNIHASLLPRWRGAAPIHRAIEAGDQETGVCIMQMDAGLDTGDVIQMQSIPIADNDTTASLHDKLASLGGGMIVDVLSILSDTSIQATKQSEVGVTYAHKIDKKESLLNWENSAVEIERRIRAFDPFPGVVMTAGDLKVKIWGAQLCEVASKEDQTPVGQVIAISSDGIVVRTGSGNLCLTELQRPGGKRQMIKEFLQAIPVNVGDSFR